jgi:hypothetical protein
MILRVRVRLVFIGVALAVVVALLFSSATKHHPRAVHPSLRVTITLGSAGVPIPRSFLGLSIEDSELQIYASHLSVFRRVVKLLRPSAEAPLSLRIGGNSADHAFVGTAPAEVLGGTVVLNRSWFRSTARMVRALDARLILDVNLATSPPSRSAAMVNTALHELPTGAVSALELGNEPDRYGHGYTIDAYVRDFNLYGRGIARVAPTIPLAGPAISNTTAAFAWLGASIDRIRPLLGILSGHRYPLSACARPGSRSYPTIARLLADRSSAGLAQSVAPVVHLARSVSIPFRLDEVNSVTCQGRSGVSDSFATALWAPDALFQLLSTGLAGLNVHIRPTTINGPFTFTARGLAPRPLIYGLILFARTIAPGGHLVSLDMSPSVAGLSAWGVALPGGRLNVLLVNKTPTQLTVTVRVPATGPAAIQRLLAPSVSATSGIRLAGQQLGPSGTLLGVRQISHAGLVAGAYDTTARSYSVLLITLQLRKEGETVR